MIIEFLHGEEPAGNKWQFSESLMVDMLFYKYIKYLYNDIKEAVRLDYSWPQITNAVRLYLKGSGVWRNTWEHISVERYYSLISKEAK